MSNNTVLIPVNPADLVLLRKLRQSVGNRLGGLPLQETKLAEGLDAVDRILNTDPLACGASVQLPVLPDDFRRSAEVTLGTDRYGRFVQANVTLRNAADSDSLALFTNEMHSADVDPEHGQTTPRPDHALADLETRLLEALADVRMLRTEIGK